MNIRLGADFLAIKIALSKLFSFSFDSKILSNLVIQVQCPDVLLMTGYKIIIYDFCLGRLTY